MSKEPGAVHREFPGRPRELAAVRIVDLQPFGIVPQKLRRRQGAMDVAVPEQPFDVLDIRQQPLAERGVVLRDAFGGLAQHGQAHGDVEPV